MKVVKWLLELCTNWIWITNRQWSLSEGVDSPCIYLYSAGSLSEFLASFTSCCGQLRRRTVCVAFIHSVSIYSPHSHTHGHRHCMYVCTCTLVIITLITLYRYQCRNLCKLTRWERCQDRENQARFSHIYIYTHTHAHTCIHTLNINTFMTLRGGYSSRKYHSNQ